MVCSMRLEDIKLENLRKLSFWMVMSGLGLFLHDFYYHYFKNKNGKITDIHHGYIGLALMALGFVLGLEEGKS